MGATASAPAAGGGNAAKFGGGGGDGTVKIGFTVPLTGALAGFGEANAFIVDSGLYTAHRERVRRSQLLAVEGESSPNA